MGIDLVAPRTTTRTGATGTGTQMGYAALSVRLLLASAAASGAAHAHSQQEQARTPSRGPATPNLLLVVAVRMFALLQCERAAAVRHTRVRAVCCLSDHSYPGG
jgi:hypothetical protein